MSGHDPTICSTGRHGCWAHCSCGWRSSLYTTALGAHLAFGDHLTAQPSPTGDDHEDL